MTKRKDRKLQCAFWPSCFFLLLLFPLYPLPLILGPSVESEGGVGHSERREKLFQKCPVPPAEDGALFSLSSDAGRAAFPTCSSGAAARH